MRRDLEPNADRPDVLVQSAPRTVFEITQLLNDLIAVIAERYGFRADEYTAVWDGLEFDPAREPHELTITIIDGRQVVITVGEFTLGNPWRPLQDIEAAFRALQRRAEVRGE